MTDEEGSCDYLESLSSDRMSCLLKRKMEGYERAAMVRSGLNDDNGMVAAGSVALEGDADGGTH